MRNFTLFTLLMVVGCGDDTVGAPPDGSTVDAAVDSRSDAPVDAPVGSDAFHCGADDGGVGTHKLFLAVDGMHLVHGASCNDATTGCTFIVNADVDVPVFLTGNASRAQIISDMVAQVQSILEPYDVEVTTTRPASGPYTMIVLGGDCSTVTGGSCVNTAALAPEDCGNTHPSDIALVFEVQGFTAGAYANLIVFDLGLTIGLSTDTVPGDCMCAQCGGQSPACNLGEVVSVTPACTSSPNPQDEKGALSAVFGCR